MSLNKKTAPIFLYPEQEKIDNKTADANFDGMSKVISIHLTHLSQVFRKLTSDIVCYIKGLNKYEYKYNKI